MKTSRIVLCTLAIGAMAAGCNTPAATTDGGNDAGMTGADGGRDTGTATDTGVGTDTGTMTDTNVQPDSGVVVNCATYCTSVTGACTAANSQYADMAACMTQCAAAMWTAGAATDTGGNTLGCRIYHAGAAATDAATHCGHAGFLGGGVCTPFRTDAPVEVTVTGTAHPAGYVRRDRMGMPAVATALVGAGIELATSATTHIPLQATDNAVKNAYNDGNPDADAAFTFGAAALASLGYLHASLDTQLRGAGFTPCSMRQIAWTPSPTGMAPVCAVQGLDGNPAHPVAGLILPDTLRIDTAVAATFPNGRALADPVVDVTLSVLLLSTQFQCNPNTNCALRTTAGMAACTGDSACTWDGTSCQPQACESRLAAACTTTPGCQVNACPGGAPCNAVSLLGVSQAPNDSAFLTTFPYFAAAH